MDDAGVVSMQLYLYMSNFDFAMSLTGTLSSEKLGVTTTVKEQVDNIEVPLGEVGGHRPLQTLHRPAEEAPGRTPTPPQETR
jgi:hypothetical protein